MSGPLDEEPPAEGESPMSSSSVRQHDFTQVRGLLEALPEPSAVLMARTLASVKSEAGQAVPGGGSGRS